MDGERKQRAARYRVRAEEIRSAAETMSHADSRVALMRLAESYERLASKIEVGSQAPPAP